jgi:putative inorganic carbon (HCO3(-)) transporter
VTALLAPPVGAPAPPTRRPPAIPLWAVALVFAAPAVGDRPLPGGGGELQVVHVVCVSAIAVVGLWMLAGQLPIRAVLVRREVRPPLWFGAGLVAVAATSTVVSPNLVRGLKVTATFAAGWLVLFGVLLVATSPGRLRTLLGTAVIGSLTVTLPILSQAGRLTPVYGGAVVRNRAQSIFADPNQFGCYAAVLVLLAVGWFLAAPRRWERVLASIGGAGAMAALVLSLSRGAWLGTVAGLLVAAAIHPALRRYLVMAAALGAVLVAAGLLAALTAPTGTAGRGPIAGVIVVVVDRLAVIDDRAANPHDVRPMTWREAVREFDDHPLLGNGPGSFSTLAASSPSVIQFAPRRHAHNAFLQIGAEMGAAGLFAGVGLAGTCGLAGLVTTRRLRRAGDTPQLGVLAGAAGALVALSVHLMVDYPIRNPVLMIVAWSVAGLLLATASSARSEHGLTAAADR